jgi:ABC-type multidrug transport system fused ATPase/permease subunit
VLPLGALVAYGALRLSTTLFTELREFLFARVTQRAVRTIALQVFRHLHALSLRFHLNRQTGGMTRDIERGTRGVSSLVSYSLFSILPTLVEITLVLGYLARTTTSGSRSSPRWRWSPTSPSPSSSPNGARTSGAR